jgi:CRISPR-associated protein Csx14
MLWYPEDSWMGVHMADANGVRIEIDPLNPAQFFACCGILELLSERSPDVLARFAYQENQFRKVTFVLSGVGEVALTGMLTALRNSKAISTTGFSGGEAPVDLEIPGTCNLTLDWWLVPERNIKSKFKLWAGQQTTLKLVQDMLGADWGNLGNDVLAFRLPMSGRFGLDPR